MADGSFVLNVSIWMERNACNFEGHERTLIELNDYVLNRFMIRELPIMLASHSLLIF